MRPYLEALDHVEGYSGIASRAPMKFCSDRVGKDCLAMHHFFYLNRFVISRYMFQVDQLTHLNHLHLYICQHANYCMDFAEGARVHVRRDLDKVPAYTHV